MKHKFYVSTKRTRKQIFKDLMRYRTDVDQGLTFKQIFYEVYSDFIEKHTADGQIYSDYRYDPLYRTKVSYLKKMIKQVKKTDDDFRWLSVLPIKKRRNEEVNPIKITTAENKISGSYIEYRYINVKASKTPELLEQINEIWRKRMQKQAETHIERANLLESFLEELENEEEEEKRKSELLRWKKENDDWR